MTEQEICDRQRENGNSEMYLRLSDTFWRAYDGGAFALARVTGYQVKRLKTIDRYQLGFSKATLEKVLEKMRAAGMEHSEYEEGQTLITFSGGDPAPDERLVTLDSTERLVDTGADYHELCSLRKELLDINLADSQLTFPELLGKVRNLQIRCLSHLLAVTST